MRAVIISDTHRKHREIEMPQDPKIDCLIHCGDITSNGEMQTIEDFAEWLKELPYPNKLITPGNHDKVFEVRDKTHAKSIKNRFNAIEILQSAGATYLEHEAITVDGVKMFFSPFSPWFYNWAFNVQRGKALEEKWAAIPTDTQLLCTHGPAYGILDQAPRGMFGFENVGCQDLLHRIQALPNLKLHCAGHIHNAYGTQQMGNYLAVNAAICNEQYQPINKPIVVEI